MTEEEKNELEESLTPKQIRFCQEYMVDLNGTQAAIRAGYSEDSATAIASQNLTKLKVAEYIAELQKDVANSLKITKEKIIDALRMLAFYDTRKYYDVNGELLPISELDDESAFALSSFEVTEETIFELGTKKVIGHTKNIKTSERKGALDMLNKMFGNYAPTKMANTDSKGNDVKPSQIVILPPGVDNLEIKEDE